MFASLRARVARADKPFALPGSAPRRLIAAIWDHPYLCLAVCLVVTIAAGWQARAVSLDNSLEVWFADDDPALTAYREFQRLFGGDEVIAVALYEPGGIVNSAGMTRLRRAGEALKGVEGIARVQSLAGSLAGQVGGGALPSPGEFDRVRGRLLSDDLTTAVLYVNLEAGPDLEQRRGRIIRDMRRALERVGGDYRMIGIGVVYDALNRLSQEDTGRLFAIACVIMAALLWLAFGSLPAVALCLAIVSTAALWAMGLMGAMGRDINMVTMVVPTLILVVGLASCVHVLRHVARSESSGERRDRVVRAVAAMLRPCFFITATTVAGFWALTASPMPVLRDLGMFAGLGIVAVFMLTFLLITPALRWPGFEPQKRNVGLLDAIALRLADFGIARRRLVLGLAGASLLAAAAAIPQLTVDTYSIGFMPADHPVRDDYRFIEEKFGAYTPVEFIVRADPVVPRETLIEAIGDWQDRAGALNGIGWTYSLADVSSQTGATEVDAYPSLYADGALRVSFAIRMQSARMISRDIDRILAQANMPAGVTIEPSGYLPLYVRMMDLIVSSQIWGFGLALATVIWALLLLFRSVGLALVAVPANLIPVAIVLGFMALAGISLDVATVTIAAVVLGIAVDDSVFFLDAFQRARRRGLREPDAIRAAIRTVGASMLLTTLVLVMGFLACAFADIKSVALFGTMLSLAMTTAVMADLTLLPALLVSPVRRRSGERPRSRPEIEGAGNA